MNEAAKAWIDYRCDDLRRQVGALDEKGCVLNLDVDKAMAINAHNWLLAIRESVDGEAPVGYTPPTQIYIHDADMEKLRNPICLST